MVRMLQRGIQIDSTVAWLGWESGHGEVGFWAVFYGADAATGDEKRFYGRVARSGDRPQVGESAVFRGEAKE